MTFRTRTAGKRNVPRRARSTLVNSVSAIVASVIGLGAAAVPALAAPGWKLPQSVQIQRSQQVLVEVDLDRVERSSVPPALFGFNIPWMNFQLGYWRDNQVRPEIISWLRPFRGAVYRYPGGTVSNWFEWEKSVGPVTSRAEQYTHFGATKAEFGFDEFLDFVKQVNGVPLVTVNLKGTRRVAWDDLAATESGTKWVQYSVRREGGAGAGLTFCQEGKGCPVRWWELGNELDWGKDAWTPERYADRARAVGLGMKRADPAIQLIAHTKTAPWDKKQTLGAAAEKFDSAVGSMLADAVYGYAFHPYYDGMSIPSVNRYMEKAVSTLAAPGGPPLFITEHARWPSRPMVGKWQPNWAQTGNLGGAISTADHLLSQMLIPNVQAAVWHSLGARGPWQLFYLDPRNDTLYPNAVYWGLRVLREGFLDDVVSARVSSPNASKYRGGYDVRAVFMRQKSGGRFSLLTVNRSQEEHKASLVIPKWAGRSVNAHQYYITGTNEEEANVKERPDRIVMQDRPVTVRFDSNGRATVGLPANSVSSLVMDGN